MPDDDKTDEINPETTAQLSSSNIKPVAAAPCRKKKRKTTGPDDKTG